MGHEQTIHRLIQQLNMNPNQLIDLMLTKTIIEFRFYPDQDDWYDAVIKSLFINDQGVIQIELKDPLKKSWQPICKRLSGDEINNQIRLK